jgi:POT family proton-dependent oligopeptide transporter
MTTKYRTAPDPNETGWPKGIPYIIGNEGCERFSFYGMKAILKVYLVAIFVQQGLQESLANQQSNAITHFFIVGVYGLPMIGAVVADRLLGKYQTILSLSLVYCAGHGVLALSHSPAIAEPLFGGVLPGCYVGLTLIALGSGGIKPCVSAHVGDQFGPGNWQKLQKVFQAFYFIINFGSFFATLFIPVIKEYWGWGWAFGIPGILMGLATLAFWMGRKVFIHVPAYPGGKLGLLDAVSSSLLLMTFGSFMFTQGQPWIAFDGVGALASSKLFVSAACFIAGLVLFSVRQRIEPDDGFLAVVFYMIKAWITKRESAPLPQAQPEVPQAVGADVADPLRDHWFFGPAVRRFGREQAEGPIAVLKIISIFFLVSIFWALFDQHATTWIDQAQQMDRTIAMPLVGEFTLLREQIPFVNPLLVMLLIPFTMYVVYPGIEKLGFRMTPLRRMTIGMMMTGTSFVGAAIIQERIQAVGDGVVHIGWQLIPYILLTLSEVMVSITGLEFAYSQAPRRMKSTIMSFWLATVALGNAIAGMLFDNEALKNWPLAQFFWLFAIMMFAAGLLFGLRAAFYKYKDYSQ